MDSWGGVDATNSPLNASWENHLSGQLPASGWWKDIQNPFTYGQGWKSLGSMDYDPGNSGYDSYSPVSSLTNDIIDADIQNWLAREHPELFDFTQGVQYGGVAGVGKVGQGIGQFGKTPEVYQEMQAAAQKYGVPVNFLQAIIAHESSGDWAYNNRAPYIGTRGERILPYVGVFESAAKSWGFNFDALIGNRAGQIEMLASGLRGMYERLHAQNPAYGWEQVSNYHYSGNPTGSYTPGDAYQYGTTNEYTGRVMSWWKQLDANAGNTWSNYTDTTQNTGIGSPQDASWGQYSQYDQALVGLAANTGAPANLLKSVLRFGQENGVNYLGNFDGSFAPMATNLANAYRQTGDWTKATAQVLGLPETSTQVVKVKQYWDQLNADMSGVFGGTPGTTSPGATTQINAIWGGQDFPITQEHGPTAWSLGAGAWMYDYAIGVLGTRGHPGIDVGMPVGTKLFAPLAGTVTRAGGSGSYYNTEAQRNTPGTGELRLRLDNGHELILGHMQNITVRAGDRVAPGMFVGTSGYPSGPHVHVEYRIPSTKMSSGWEAIDPRLALGGQFTGFNQGAKTGLGYTQALTFQNLMRAGASGQAIPSGPVYSQGGGRSAWNTWLRTAMGGGDPNQIKGVNYASMYQSLGGGAGATHSAGDGHNH